MNDLRAMNTIKQTYVIAATPEQVWEALTNPALIREWSGAAVEFPAEAGAPYSLWDGTIGGTIVEFVPMERLVQTWQPADWQRDDSVVRITLVPEEGTTLVDLVHENVEESDYDGTSEGWDVYYLGAIKRMLEAQATGKKVARRTRAPKKSASKTKAARKTVTRKKTRAKKSASRKTPATAATRKRGPTRKNPRR